MTIVNSILLLLIAIIGAWVALQQMLIARAKLNHDLFDRRFKVYTATQTYLITMLRDQGGSEQDADDWHSVVISAPFLFDEEISGFLREVADRGSFLRAWIGDKRIYEVPERINEYNDNIMWIANSQKTLEEKFQDSMNLFKLNPLSVKTIFSSSRSSITPS